MTAPGKFNISADYKVSFFLLSCLLCLSLFIFLPLNNDICAQELRTMSFSDEQGLSSNLIKNAVQDGEGFIWVATDAGVLRYDGKKFTAFNDGLPSLFVKQILYGQDGKLYVVNDMGVGYLKRSGGSYKYISIISGSSSQSSSKVTYPKTLYIDKNGVMWISEREAIVRYEKGRIKKYFFEEKYQTDSYTRSFLFAEDPYGRLIASSWRGYLFVYDKAADRFDLLPYSPPGNNYVINQIEFSADGLLWAATGEGILRFSLSNDLRSIKMEVVCPLKTVSAFSFSPAGDLYIGTWFYGVHLWPRGFQANTRRHIDQLDFSAVNSIFFDREGSAWIASDDGLGLVQRTYFARAGYDQNYNSGTSHSYILNLLRDQNGSVYFSDQEAVFRILMNGNSFRYEKVVDSRNKRVLSFDVKNNEVWVSYRNGDLEYIGSGRNRSFTGGQLGGRLNSLKIDSEGKLWGFLDYRNIIVVIDRNFNIKHFPPSVIKGNLRVVKASDDGSIYFATDDEENYLYRYDQNANKFYNLSRKLDFGSSRSKLVIFDLFLQKDGGIWIASSIGLHRLDKNGIHPVNEINRLPVPTIKAVYVDKRNRLWLGTEQGVMLYSNDQLTVFNRRDGLPNSTVSERSVIVDEKQRVWAGTASGLAYWQNGSDDIRITPAPRFISLSLNDRLYSPQMNEVRVTGASDLKAVFSALSYPDRILYQVRLLGFKDEWSDASPNNTLQFTNLSPGEYTLQVRAKQSGYLSSSISEFRFVVLSPWYSSWWMYLVYLAALVIAVYYVIMYIQASKISRLEARKNELERLVDEKTHDLQEEKSITEGLLAETEKARAELERVNSDLRKANELKSDLLSIAAHDLKNPLQSIIGFSKLIKEDVLNSNIAQMGDIIFSSSIRMLNLITDLLDSVAVESTNLVMNKTSIDLLRLVEKVVSENSHRALQKSQRIVLNADIDCEIEADEKWLREAFDNLLSNAVKYSPAGKNIHVTVSGSSEFVRISVRDEGPGLTEDDKRNLFGKFQRLSAKPTGGESSTGLGLSIVKEIVNLHEGKIWAESTYGNGSTFIIELKVLRVNLAI